MAKLLTKAIHDKLLKNGSLPDSKKQSLKPALKIFGGSACTWLITELDSDGDTMFGLCDLGQGYPELGYISLQELSEARFQFGLPAERDRWFEPSKTLAEYADQARIEGRVVA